MDGSKSHELSLQEKRVKQVAAYSPYVHVFGLLVLLLISYLKPNHYFKFIEALTVISLIVTLIINKLYLWTGKQIEAKRDLTEKEQKEVKREYFMKFFSPIAFWTLCNIFIQIQSRSS